MNKIHKKAAQKINKFKKNYFYPNGLKAHTQWQHAHFITPLPD